MSGHSKWANIKHKKDAADKKKGKIFSRITKEIIASVKRGGGDPNANPTLRNILASARAANMPNANIDRAIKRALGEEGTVNYEEIIYEGYAPGGVAILVQSLTDNRNRTAGEVRMVFDRANGTLAGGGTVLWMFKKKAHFIVSGENANEEKLMEILLDAGLENIEVDGGIAEIWGDPESFEPLSNALQKAGIAPEEANIVQAPDNFVEVKNADVARQILNLIEKLEELDDTQAVFSNCDIPQGILEAIHQQ